MLGADKECAGDGCQVCGWERGSGEGGEGGGWLDSLDTHLMGLSTSAARSYGRYSNTRKMLPARSSSLLSLSALEVVVTISRSCTRLGCRSVISTLTSLTVVRGNCHSPGGRHNTAPQWPRKDARKAGRRHQLPQEPWKSIKIDEERVTGGGAGAGTQAQGAGGRRQGRRRWRPQPRTPSSSWWARIFLSATTSPVNLSFPFHTSLNLGGPRFRGGSGTDGEGAVQRKRGGGG